MFIVVVSLIALTAGLSAIGGFIFYLLWNWLMVGVFNLPVLTFFQAWGFWFLLWLIGNLFKSASSSSNK